MNEFYETEIFSITNIILSLTFIFGIMGNLLLISFVLFYKKNNKLTKIFIMNLAISDLLLILICIPTTIYVNYRPFKWIFGIIGCKLSSYVQSIAVSSSVLTITVISIDRYIIICKPFILRTSYTKYKVNFIVLLIWIFSLVINLPLPIMKSVEKFEKTEGNLSLVYASYCYEDWNYVEVKLLFEVSIILIQFFIPSFVISFTLFCIFKKLWKDKIDFSTELSTSVQRKSIDKRLSSIKFQNHTEKRASELIQIENFNAKFKERNSLKSNAYQNFQKVTSSILKNNCTGNGYQRLCQSRKKIVILIFILFVLFMVSWLPYYLVFLTSEVLVYTKLRSNLTMNETHLIQFLNTEIHPYTTCLAFSNSALNGALFCLFSSDFRKIFLRLFIKKN